MKNILLTLSMIAFTIQCVPMCAVKNTDQPVQTKTQTSDPKTADLHTLVGRTSTGTLFAFFTALSALAALGVSKIDNTSEDIVLFKAFNIRLFGAIAGALGYYTSYNFYKAYRAYQRLKKTN